MMKFLHGNLARKLGMSIILVLIIYAIGILFYTTFEKWGVTDSIYFITMTISTVGYGDFVPQTHEGKMFTIFLVWFGVSIAFFAIYSLAEAREKIVDSHVIKRLRTLRHIATIRAGKKDWPEPDVRVSEKAVRKKYLK